MVTIVSTAQYNDSQQWVYLTLDVDGDMCQFDYSAPLISGGDLQSWCDAREDKFKIIILNEMYPGADYSDQPGDTELEKFTAWIVAGHENPDGTVITKVPFQASWSVNIVTAENDMKDSVFYKKTPQEINNYIDANWTNLTDSKATFKKLVKEVRDIILRQGWED